MTTITFDNNHFCNVSAGINECSICYNKAYFSLSIPQKLHRSLPKMMLLKCGHGLCKNCMDTMLKKERFECPFCRDKPYHIRENLGIGKIKKTIYSFEDYIDEWKPFLNQALNCGHSYSILYNQIKNNYHNLVKERYNAKLKKKKKIKLLEKKKTRALSRANAVCKVCGKDTFNSEKQLRIHMSKKHPICSKIITKKHIRSLKI